MKPSILITFLFALAFSTEASSDAPPVPTTATFTTSLSSDKGIWVDEIPIGRGKEVRALFGQGLTLEVARIDHAATANVIVTGNNEAVGNAGYHDSLAVYLHYGQATNGTNDVYYVDLLPPGTFGRVSSGAGEELELSIFNGITAWRHGSDIYMADVLDPSGPTPTLVATGTQPDVGENVIVMEYNGDLQIFDIQTASVTQHASNVGSISWPSIGGGLVAYSAGGGIAFRHLNDITLESELDGPCANHGDPRVSRNGTIILHAGRGCPSGSDGIFVTYLEPDGSQELYKLHDLPQMPIRDRDIYSIASTSVGFIDNQNTIRYFELVP